MNNSFIKKAIPHFVAILVFLILSAVYFSPQISGKQIQQGDIISYQGMSQEVREYKSKTGTNSLWTNAIFGGMPTYQITRIKDGNLLSHIDTMSRLFIKGPIGLFLLLMVIFYVTMVLLGVNTWLSIIGAVVFGLTTNNLVLLEAGHLTKINTIAFFAPIVGGVLLTFRKQYWLGAILFGLGLSLNITANHLQMTYYLGLNLFIFGAIWLFYSIKNKALNEFVKGVGILIFMALLALGTAASNLMPTYEYSRDTMRGKPILEKTVTESSSSSSDVEGLNWNYAMNWSNGGIDLISSFIPGVAGGGSGEKVSRSSSLYKNAEWRMLLQRSGGKAPLYWGGLPSTSGPIYFGAVFFFLFVLSLFVLKGPIKWWLGAAVLFTFFLSLGNNASWLNRTLFDYFPLFSKFRTPNSALCVVSLLVPFAGILGLSAILEKPKEKIQSMNMGLYISAGILGVICLFYALMGASFYEMSGTSDAEYSQYGFDIEVLMNARAALMSSDAWRSFLLIGLSAALIWAYLNDKIKSNILIIGISVLALFDVWSVGKRYVAADDFVAQRNYKQNFEPRPVDKQIMNSEKSRGDYRVLDLSVNTFNSSATSYFHNTIGGYNAAKLQRFQDIIDYHISKNNQSVLNMLNTKYIIGREQQAQQNPNAAGTAWFVDDILMAANANKEIEALDGFNPKQTAIVHQEFNTYINAFDPAKNGSIALSNYIPNHLTYTTNTTSEQLAVFSEIWYGPDKGWNAYLDGKAVDHIRANYLLRAMRVPAGKHTIEFKFEPKAYTIGRMISLISSLLLLVGLGFFLYKKIKEQA